MNKLVFRSRCGAMAVMLLMSLLLMALSTTGALAAKRVALVVGIDTYQNASPLRNPGNDAEDIGQALRQRGFEVVIAKNTSQREFLRAAREFSKLLATADAGLFYYAGHGIQVDGVNYFIPSDAVLEDVTDLQFEAISLDFVLKLFENPQKVMAFLIDACRDSPFGDKLQRTASANGSSRSLVKGLAEVSSGIGTYIGYSTEPGRVARDGLGRNSPFAAALLKNMDVKGGDIESVMRQVRQEVFEATNGEQLPWGNSSLMGRGFSFSGGEAVAALTPAAPEATSEVSAAELSFWESVRTAKNKAAVEAYLQKYPEGHFSDLAKALLPTLTDDGAKQGANTEQETKVASNSPDTSDQASLTRSGQQESILIAGISREINRLNCRDVPEYREWNAALRAEVANQLDRLSVMYSLEGPSQTLLDLLSEQTVSDCPGEIKNAGGNNSTTPVLTSDDGESGKTTIGAAVGDTLAQSGATDTLTNTPVIDSLVVDDGRTRGSDTADATAADDTTAAKIADAKKQEDEKQAAEKQAAEKRAAEKRAAEKRAAEKRAAEKKAAEKRAAERREADRKKREQNAASTSGKTTPNGKRPDPIRYSYSIWRDGILRNSKRTQASTPYGRIECYAIVRGRSERERMRSCKWL